MTIPIAVKLDAFTERTKPAMELSTAAGVSSFIGRIGAAFGGLFFLAAECYSSVQLSLRATGGV
jgi:hypothetical protein